MARIKCVARGCYEILQRRITQRHVQRRERERKGERTRECIHRARKLWGQLSPGDNSYCCNKVALPPSRAPTAPRRLCTLVTVPTPSRVLHIRYADTVCTLHRRVCMPWDHVCRVARKLPWIPKAVRNCCKYLVLFYHREHDKRQCRGKPRC